MKNTCFAIILAILLLAASTVMWGQATPSAATGLTIGNQAADVVNTPVTGGVAGGHQSHGCYLCHTPHSAGLLQKGSAITTWNNACIPTAPATSCTGQTGAGVGIGVAGNVYLWGQALGQLTYNSWDSTGGTTFSGTGLTTSTSWLSHPEVHTLMCLSCHDGSTTGSSYDLGYGTAGGYNASGGSNGSGSFGPPGLKGVVWAYNNGTQWSQGSLMNSHPIHAHYTVSGVTVPGLWQVKINSTGHSVYFTDTGFNYWSASSTTGHPARLWTDGADAYVECTTCHEPHRFSQYAFPNNGSWNPTDGGTWEVGLANTTVYYLRGPYSDANATTDGPSHTSVATGNTTANGEMNAQFCRSCHYDKSVEYFNNDGVAH